MSKSKQPVIQKAPKRALLNAAEAAEYLGVTERWIRESAWTRRIAHVKLGRALRFDPDDLDSYREAHRVGPSPG